MSASSDVPATDETEARLAAWLASRLGVETVTIDDFAPIPTGHSAETVRLTIRWDDDGPRVLPVVLRVRPQPPSLLEPYDLAKQYRLLRALERHRSERRAHCGTSRLVPSSGASSS